MKEIRIIKKYPNRRLYDTDVSCYITLDDVKKLILSHIKFKVIDVRTEQDMTNHVLLQIINEEEADNSPIFTTEILQNIIRFYGNPLQKNMSQFLEKMLSFFTDNQPDFQTILTEKSPFHTMAELTKQNIALWQSIMSKDSNNSASEEKKNKRKTKK